MPNEFTALGPIYAPGTSVAGYQRGHEVRAQVVEAWGLAVGVDVIEGDLPAEYEATPAPQRPAESATRADWEVWGVATGMTEQEAADASIEDLQAATYEPPVDEGVQRPADSARKVDWQRYAEARGADPAWANDPTTTKAELQAWEPTEPGDTVAVAATEANQA
jgi:hypothetical protein